MIGVSWVFAISAIPLPRITKTPTIRCLFMHDDNRVYGGACLRISTPQHPIILNSEQDILPPAGKFYFSLREHLPEMELDKYAYSEFVRIVIDPCLRKGVAIKELYYCGP